MNTATKPTLKCLRCGYSWTPRGDVEPQRIKSCPDCKHRKWKEPKPAEDEPRIFENLVSRNVISEQSKMQKQEPIPSMPEPELTTSREYDQYRKAKMKREQTEKPREHTCHDCGEAAEFSIEGTDLNWTDRGVEYITNIEWFCGECYEKRTK